MTVEQPAISAPTPTTGPQTDARYYIVTIAGENYRLHDEWALGADFQATPERWERTDVGQLDLPTDTLIALRTIWSSLFRPTSA